jgi:hypothetical protein
MTSPEKKGFFLLCWINNYSSLYSATEEVLGYLTFAYGRLRPNVVPLSLFQFHEFQKRKDSAIEKGKLSKTGHGYRRGLPRDEEDRVRKDYSSSSSRKRN